MGAREASLGVLGDPRSSRPPPVPVEPQAGASWYPWGAVPFLSQEIVVMAGLMLVAVLSLRQVVEADLRAARARRRALKALARSVDGTYERTTRRTLAGERVRFDRHGFTFLVYFEVVMAADDPSSYTRVQILKRDPDRSFPVAAVVPEDFLERADNLLFGREDRLLDDPALDDRVIVRAEPGVDLDALKDESVRVALKTFLDAGSWRDDFLLESVPDQLKVSVNRHLDEPGPLIDFTNAAVDLLAAFPTLALQPAGSDD